MLSRRLLSQLLGQLSFPSSGSAVECSSTIVLQFDQGLEPGPAKTTTNYTILAVGLGGQLWQGIKTHCREIGRLHAALPDSDIAHTSRPLKVGQRYELIINGDPPEDWPAAGTLNEATSQGGLGSNYVTTLARQDYVVDLPGPTAGHERGAMQSPLIVPRIGGNTRGAPTGQDGAAIAAIDHPFRAISGRHRAVASCLPTLAGSGWVATQSIRIGVAM